MAGGPEGSETGRWPARPRVLLVDDEEENLAFCQRVLRAECDVVTALDGKSALEALVHAPVDLVICDQRMPEMEGSVVLEQVRALCPDARRMIVSAYAAPDDLLEAINRGEVDRYLVKPFSPEELLEHVREILASLQRERRARAELRRLRRERDRLRAREEELVRMNGELSARLAQKQVVTAPASHGAALPLPSVEEAKAAMTRELKRAARYARPLSLLLLRFGPPPLTPALMRSLLEQTPRAVRELDVAARLDAQSIVLLLPETERESAGIVAARFVELAARTAAIHGEAPPPMRHAVASFPSDGLGLWGLLAHAGRIIAET